VTSTSANNSASVRRLLLALAFAVAIISGVAIHFAVRAQREHSRAASYERELAAKDRELMQALNELKRCQAFPASSATIASVAPGEQALVPTGPVTAMPTPSNSPTPGKVFNSHALLEMVRQTRLRTFRSIYEPLLTQLNFSPEQRTKFYDLKLAVEWPKELIEKLQDEALTDDERNQIQAQIAQIHDSALGQIQQMFGSGDYQLYDSYHKTETERTLIQEFRQQLDSSSTPISDWQSARLSDLLIQARTQYPPVNDDMTASDEAAFAQASQFLIPEQLTAFRDYLRNREELARDMRKQQPPGG
jgi:hypothetical protein